MSARLGSAYRFPALLAAAAGFTRRTRTLDPGERRAGPRRRRLGSRYWLRRGVSIGRRRDGLRCRLRGGCWAHLFRRGHSRGLVPSGRGLGLLLCRGWAHGWWRGCRTHLSGNGRRLRWFRLRRGRDILRRIGRMSVPGSGDRRCGTHLTWRSRRRNRFRHGDRTSVFGRGDRPHGSNLARRSGGRNRLRHRRRTSVSRCSHRACWFRG